MLCEAHRRHIPQAALADDLACIMGRLQLSDEVRAQATALFTADDPTAAIERQREKLEAELRRLNRMYQSGNVLDSYYDTEAKRIRGELARLAMPAHQENAQAAIAALDDMARLWQGATLEEQADIVGCLFERVDVDLDERQIVGIVPKKEYAALCEAAFATSGRDGGRNCARREPCY